MFTRLSLDDVLQLVGQVAELTAAEVPLGDGLRAAAAQSPPKLAAIQREWAAELEQGRSLADAFDSPQSRLPAHWRGVLAAAARTGRLPQVLADVVEQEQETRELWRGMLSALVYPCLVLQATVLMFAAFSIFVVPTFRDIYIDFGLRLSPVTAALFWFSDFMVWCAAGVILAPALAVILLPVALGRCRWQGLLFTVPVIGPIWHWLGVSAMSRLLGTLCENGVALPEALRFTAEGTRDPYVAEQCRWLADRVAEGQPLARLLARTHRLPSSLTTLIGWGETTGRFAESLQIAGDLFAGYVRLRSTAVRSFVPPILFLLVTLIVSTMTLVVLLPMFQLISGLT